MKHTCPNEELLDAYVLERLQEPALTLVEEHVLVCRACLGALMLTDAMVKALKDHNRTLEKPHPQADVHQFYNAACTVDGRALKRAR